LNSLKIIDLSSNHLLATSQHPFHKGAVSVTSFRRLMYQAISFTGGFEPTWFVGASNLRSFIASNNGFSSQIRSSMRTTYPQLKSLDVPNNNFSG